MNSADFALFDEGDWFDDEVVVSFAGERFVGHFLFLLGDGEADGEHVGVSAAELAGDDVQVAVAVDDDFEVGLVERAREVGGDDAEIIPYQRPVGSGSQTAMISLVMKGKKMVEPKAYQVEVDMGGLVDAIAEYDNAKYSLGYSYFYYVNTMYKRDTIKMLSIDGIEPSIETIKNGKYPIYTNGFIVYNKAAKEDSNTIKWVNNVLSKRGSKIIEDAGYVPVSDGNAI